MNHEIEELIAGTSTHEDINGIRHKGFTDILKTVAKIGTFFIPGVGPGISAGLTIADAASQRNKAGKRASGIAADQQRASQQPGINPPRSPGPIQGPGAIPTLSQAAQAAPAGISPGGSIGQISPQQSPVTSIPTAASGSIGGRLSTGIGGTGIQGVRPELQDTLKGFLAGSPAGRPPQSRIPFFS